MFLKDTVSTNYLIFNMNNTIVPDSLSGAEQVNQTICQDSVWNTLQNSLFHNPPLGKGEATHFLTKQPAPPFENLSYNLTEFDWFFIISLVFFLFLMIIRLRSFNLFTTSYDVLLKRKSGSGYGSSSQINNRLPIFFSLCMWVGLSLVLYCMAFYGSSESLPITIADNRILKWSFIVTAVFILLQLFLLKIVSILFNVKNLEVEYRRLRIKLYFILSILVFPLVFLFIYYQFISSFGQIYSILISLLLICIFLIFMVLLFHQLIQGWRVFRKKFRLYEYFLYLCTIEILPLLLFLKLAISSL